MKNIVADYEEKAGHIFDKYMLLYATHHPGAKAQKTAKEFLITQNSNYRKEVSAVAVDAIRDKEANTSIISQILALNNIHTIKLHDEIMRISE